MRLGPYFAKTAFHLDWEHGVLRCPHQVEMPFAPGAVVQFPAQTCAVCPQRAHCTESTQGRSVTIHPDERFLAELRTRQLTPAGRACAGWVPHPLAQRRHDHPTEAA